MGGCVGALAHIGIHKSAEIRGKPQASATLFKADSLTGLEIHQVVRGTCPCLASH